MPLFHWLDQQYHFTLDPCCTRDTRLCHKYYTKQDDGLKQDWGNACVFMNPPYRREIGDWVKKAYEESRKGATVVCLIPARTDTQWWKNYCLQANDAIFLTGRVKFLENGVSLKAGAPFPSVIVAFHSSVWRPHAGLNCLWRDYKEIEKLYANASRGNLNL
jgi:site-specific DNA-methyltransferase (adenine-specific)